MSSGASGKSLFLSLGLDFIKNMEIIILCSILLKTEKARVIQWTSDKCLPCAWHFLWIVSKILMTALWGGTIYILIAQMRKPEGLSNGPKVTELGTTRVWTQIPLTDNMVCTQKMVFTTTFTTATWSMSWDICKASSLLAQMMKSFLEFKKGFLAT